MDNGKYDPKKKAIRRFDIEVISLPIVYNRYGDHDPNGLLYVLKKDAERIRQKALEMYHKEIPQPYEEVRPLVIRANVGDEIEVNLSTELDRRVSMHVQGLDYDVRKADGACVGYNPDTTVGNCKSINYTWYANTEGVHLFHDMADARSGEEGSNIHGLFGAIIIEEPGSTWYDPVTGEPLESGLFADIYHPVNKSFREYTIFFHDELEIKDRNGNSPVDPHTGLESNTTGISYRAEPMRNRNMGMLSDIDTESHNNVVTDEDISMSSWVYGDPATEILRAYVGDPSRIRLLHAGVKETHVFHLHNHQWRLEPGNPNSTMIDSISISPQECYTLDILYGAGSLNGMVGDAIWHCHLYPHFHEGMWGLWRVFDRYVDGTGFYPDQTPIRKLMPLKDRPMPPEADHNHPGYPSFINGNSGSRPMQPPYGIKTPDSRNKIEPTDMERNNFVKGADTGALYTRTCLCNSNCERKVFDIAVVQANIIYNSYGWHDPQGRFFVLKDEIRRHGGLEAYISKVSRGCIPVEPLVIRANAGDCIEIRLTNLLPEYLKESEFQLRTLTDMAGYHIHLVKFDTIVSDGGANGWNNISGAGRNETLIERFFVNEELHTVFFHDHLNANSHQQHGLFGALIIEPAGSTFHDIYSYREIECGTRAVIRRVDGSEFREYALFVHDFALLYDKDNSPLNPPPVPGSHDDPGVMGINYRSEPMRERLIKNDDPAYLFSSYVHGDPATPILETYPGEEMVIRLLDGAHEEQHVFNIAGMSWRKEINDSKSRRTSSQTIGLSETFNIRIDEPYEAGDYLYYFGGSDDIWLGLWGIIRAYRKPHRYLYTLCRGKADSDPIEIKPVKDSVIRKYEVAAIEADIPYNKHGDHDPDGLLFVPLDQMKEVVSGRMKPKPLILRANAGDWIEVTLHNKLSKPVPYHDYPRVPLDMKYQPSNRVSMNPQFLKYNVIQASGINVGYNEKEQTVGPGESKKYLWYADKEYGTCTIQSFADIRNHRYHGLFGAIIIEPPGAVWYQDKPKRTGEYMEQVDITATGMDSYREFVVFIQNGIRLLDRRGNLIKTNEGAENGKHIGNHGIIENRILDDTQPHFNRERQPNEIESFDLKLSDEDRKKIELENELKWKAVEEELANSIKSIRKPSSDAKEKPFVHVPESEDTQTVGKDGKPFAVKNGINALIEKRKNRLEDRGNPELESRFEEGLRNASKVSGERAAGTGKEGIEKSEPALEKEKGRKNCIRRLLDSVRTIGRRKEGQGAEGTPSDIGQSPEGIPDTGEITEDRQWVINGSRAAEGSRQTTGSRLRQGLIEDINTSMGNDAAEEDRLEVEKYIRELLDSSQKSEHTGKEEAILLPPEEQSEDIDAEDTGEKGYNYRSERFHNRLRKHKDISKVFSSRRHGDPSTPVFKAYTGQRVVFRVLMPADKPRNVSFTVHGHIWKAGPQDSYSRLIPLQGAISVGNVFNMELDGGARKPGDYLYRSGSLMWDVESGMWGILRVKKQKKCCRIWNRLRIIFKKICKAFKKLVKPRKLSLKQNKK